MAEHRAKAQNLVLVNPAPFGAMHTYYDKLPLAVMVEDAFWLPVRSNLRAGDLIRCVQVGPGRNGKDRVASEIEVVVIEANEKAVEVEARGKEFRVSDASEAAPAPEKGPDEVYVPTECKAVHKGFGRFDIVRIDSGEVIANIEGKEDAQAVAAGSKPLPEPA